MRVLNRSNAGPSLDHLRRHGREWTDSSTGREDASASHSPGWPRKCRYSDYRQLNTNTLPAGSRERNVFGESLRAGYELREGFDVWVQGALNQRRYLQYVNIAGQRRDSDGWSVTGARPRPGRRQQARRLRRLFAAELLQRRCDHGSRHFWPGRHLERLSTAGRSSLRRSIHQ